MAKKQVKSSKLERFTKVVEAIKQTLILILLVITLFFTITKGYAIESIKVGEVEIKLIK